MTGYLLVPIHVEALFLPEDKQASSLLPSSNSKPNTGQDNSNLPEGIISQPVQNQEPYQKPGVHLHWFLPTALTRGTESEDKKKINFLSVPNRWLITRQDQSGVKKQWVVESDYIYPQGQGGDSVVYPLPTDDPSAPYRRLGRNMSLDEWLKNEYLHVQGGLKGEYLGSELTAVGYGVPSFATFYPQCHSVFGFYDGEFKSSFPDGLKYSVIGWYGNPKDDFLKEYRSFCYGMVSKPIQEYISETKKIAIGSNGIEALSAYLATELAGGQNHHKALIEEQLDYLAVQPKLTGNKLDLDPKLLEDQHERGFNAVYGGSQWIIQLDTPPNNTAGLPQEKAKVNIPTEFAAQLDELNRLQKEYDRADHEIADMLQQISTNWSISMLQKQSLEAARQLIETQDLPLLNIKKADNEKLFQEKLEPVRFAIDQAITQHNQQEGVDHYTLRQTAAARYWQPKEPVVLIVGEGEPAFVKKMGEPLNCTLVQGIGDEQTITKPILDKILQEADQLPALGEQQPWSIFLEWEAEFNPIRTGGPPKIAMAAQISPQGPTQGLVLASVAIEGKESGELYPADFITGNFVLAENAVELKRQNYPGGNMAGLQNQAGPGSRALAPGFIGSHQEPQHIYRGSAILTPHAGTNLKQSIVDYLQTLVDASKKEEPGSKGLAASGVTWFSRLLLPAQEAAGWGGVQEWLNKNIDNISRDYEAGLISKREAFSPPGSIDPILTFLKAYQTLQSVEFLSQAMSGFNDLLVHRQAPQLSSADPLNLVAQNTVRPTNEFSPIRAGMMKILQIRLVDTFGRKKELPFNDVIASEHMRSPSDEQNQIMLPPRLVQPARLNFRWLAAGSSLQAQGEMNTHPATNPICGWLLPSFLDNSLMVYDQAGIALGSLAAVPDAQWRPAPGSNTTKVEDITDPTLKRVILHLSNPQNPEGFFNGFIRSMAEALENIAPDHPDEPVGMALLIGDPIAVVRASLQLEVFGRPAVRQDWSLSHPTVGAAAQDKHVFRGVNFPVRLGEAKQLNDSLIGYWLEAETGEFIGSFCPPLTNIHLTVDNTLKTLTMLLDPHGKVHATSGILPVKAIDIPADQYTDLLEYLAVTFLAAPILTDQNLIKTPFPAEPGYSWNWFESREGIWKEISPVTPQEAFTAPQEIREVWLKLTQVKNYPL
jgi:hypothetical protein